jgi:hypothetical protein
MEHDAAELDAEVRRRLESQRQMGFDALYTAAYLQAHGPTPVDSPLELKHGEIACFTCPATLARMQTRTSYVGASSGFSIPIGHTGIRYRVGSFHGRPIQQQTMAKLDVGTLIVTNLRLAFVGRAKSVAVPLVKVMHVDVFTDAIAVFHEGKENADYFLVAAPKQALFYINWVIASAASLAG